MQHKLSTFIVQWFAQILGGLLYAYLYPPYAADDVSGELWQFLSAIHDKGDALTFFE